MSLSYYNVGSRWIDDAKDVDSYRYRSNVRDVAGVIDSMNMSVVILFGVDSQSSVRDIVACSQRGYSYIHRSLGYYDGRDFALLYKGDHLSIESVVGSIYWNYVEALSSGGTRIGIYMTRRADKLLSLEPQNRDRELDVTLLCGEFSSVDVDRLQLCDPFRDCDYLDFVGGRGRRGSRIALDRSSLRGVYITEWLFDRWHRGDMKEPLPLYVIFEL